MVTSNPKKWPSMMAQISGMPCLLYGPCWAFQTKACGYASRSHLMIFAW